MMKRRCFFNTMYFPCRKYGCLFCGSSFSDSVTWLYRSAGKSNYCFRISSKFICQFVIGCLTGNDRYTIVLSFCCYIVWHQCAYIGSANAAPFYMITSGDLIRFIWVNPKWSFHDTGSIIANGAFLMGSGLVFGSLLFLRHKFWSSEWLGEPQVR